MSLIDNITSDMKEAMKAKSELKLSVLRMLKSAIKNKQIELKTQEDLKEEQIIQVIKSEAKKRQDSIVSYSDGGRKELADKEKQEFEILSEYLPKQMSGEAVKVVVKKIVASLGEVGPTDFGRVMGAAMKELKDKADGTIVSKAVKKVLDS